MHNLLSDSIITHRIRTIREGRVKNLNNIEIAEKLKITPSTLDSFLKAYCPELGVRRWREATRQERFAKRCNYNVIREGKVETCGEPVKPGGYGCCQACFERTAPPANHFKRSA